MSQRSYPGAGGLGLPESEQLLFQNSDIRTVTDRNFLDKVPATGHKIVFRNCQLESAQVPPASRAGIALGSQLLLPEKALIDTCRGASLRLPPHPIKEAIKTFHYSI